MIKELIIVEGKQDVNAINKAVEADCIMTHGFNLHNHTLTLIKQAYKKRGIIILTDPDYGGEKIRNFLSKRFPDAKHAFIPKAEATANNDIGVEQATPEAIRNALNKVRCLEWQEGTEFSHADLVKYNLNGVATAAVRRAKLGAALGIGYANAKTFLQRLNKYGVSRTEFEEEFNKMVLDEKMEETK